jgi:hypothetical protein
MNKSRVLLAAALTGFSRRVLLIPVMRADRFSCCSRMGCSSGTLLKQDSFLHSRRTSSLRGTVRMNSSDAGGVGGSCRFDSVFGEIAGRQA